MDSSLGIDKTGLILRLDRLAQIGALENGGVTRWALSDADKAARDLTVAWMEELGMSVRVDQVGNILGIRAGERDLPPVMLGSHLDSVTEAGRFDGSYGVMAALECVRSLNESGTRTIRPIAVAAFTNEEGVRYAPGMLGSAAYVGKLSVEQVRAITGTDGSSFGEELERIGYAGNMECGEIRPHAYLELHIEQGPLLDSSGILIGVVEAVVGITWLEVTVTGMANHAGTTPIDLRRDAGLGAARLVTHMREIAESLGKNQRMTCGRIAFEPNAINVIPGKALFTVDMRNSDGKALEMAEAMLRAYAKELEASQGLSIAVRALEHVPPVRFDPDILDAVERSAVDLGLPFQRMVSGAGHDAQLMAQICPAAMIFVPSKDGISHNPSEYSSPGELEAGANVLLHSALRLANHK